MEMPTPLTLIRFAQSTAVLWLFIVVTDACAPLTAFYWYLQISMPKIIGENIFNPTLAFPLPYKV